MGLSESHLGGLWCSRTQAGVLRVLHGHDLGDLTESGGAIDHAAARLSTSGRIFKASVLSHSVKREEFELRAVAHSPAFDMIHTEKCNVELHHRTCQGGYNNQ